MSESLEEARARVARGNYIAHEEPDCDKRCGNMAPHKHGLPCFKSCTICEAVCHPACPAFKE